VRHPGECIFRPSAATIPASREAGGRARRSRESARETFSSEHFRRRGGMARMIRRFLLPLALLAPSAFATPVYIGTGATAIYQADFDPDTGRLTKPQLAGEYGNPGFLALHPTLPILYCTGRPKKPLADGAGSVAAFGIRGSGGLEFLGETTSSGSDPCHLTVDATGRTLAVANYGDGRISTIRLGSEGELGETANVISNTGSGPNVKRQEGPHAHGVYFDNTNSLLFVPDLGLDKILIHPFGAKTSKTGAPLPPFALAPGAGPRHMAFSPDGKNAYIIDELANTITAASYSHGKFETLAIVPTLPAEFKGNSSTAEVEVHPDGNFVYGSNRGHDSIAVFRRDPATGLLTFIQHAPCGGKNPRHFKIAPGGRWLLCAHQDTNSVSVLPLDPATGKLGKPVETVSVPKAICVVFARETAAKPAADARKAPWNTPVPGEGGGQPGQLPENPYRR
jgi:6-phosphogluconolactonase